MDQRTGEKIRVHVSPPFREEITDGPSKRHALTERLNYLIDECLKMGASHLWIVDGDVEAPSHGLQTLLDLDVDVASGVYCFHNRKELSMFGVMLENVFKVKPKDLNFIHKEVIGDSERVGGGSGCLLVKRRVLERLRFVSVEGRGPDVYFWHRAQEAGFSARVHFGVLCGHLPEWPLRSY